MDEMAWCVMIYMKAIDQVFRVIVFIALYTQGGFWLLSLDETQVCGHLNESCWPPLSCSSYMQCDTVYYTLKDGPDF